MFEEIFKKIKDNDNIVIVRHIGADPDALSSQMALRDSIKLTFPQKKVFAWGGGNTRFDYLPKLDKLEDISNVLLIVVDTPDKKRVDFGWNVTISDSIKLDHHPYIETFCNLEYIDDLASSASQIILELINSTPLKMDKQIATTLYTGIISDTNRFMYNCSSKLFGLVSNLLGEYDIDTTSVYANLYLRPINEVRLQGYIGENMIVTPNGLGYIKISNDILNKFSVDVGSSGNMVGTFNFIDGVIVWAIVTEDIKNNLFKINIRSRGPVINSIAEQYNGGGHKLASGAKIFNMKDVDSLLEKLDMECLKYNERGDIINENK